MSVLTAERAGELSPLALARIDRVRHTEAKSSSQVPTQLPLWHDKQRAMPNVYARSAIFGVRNRRMPRRSFLNTPIFVLGSNRVTYTGIELRAEDDELVWLEILNLAKQWSLNAWVEFSVYAICKALAWPTSSTYYHRVHNSLLRLKATAVCVSSRHGEKGVAVSMLDAYEWTDGVGNALPRRRVRLNPAMGALFANDQFIRVQWATYRTLTPIARRLFDFATSHRQPFPVKLSSLREMCGSDCESRPRRWRQAVLLAISELNSRGLLAGEIRGELLHFSKPSLSSDDVRERPNCVVR